MTFGWKCFINLFEEVSPMIQAIPISRYPFAFDRISWRSQQ